MATHWDRYRGFAAGRCAPTTFQPPAGQRCFLLGEDPAREAVDLTPGDYTEVRQVVDCTDLDLLVATLDTVGQVAGTYRLWGLWPGDSDELWRFDGDPAAPSLVNRVVPPGEPLGFPLDHVGAIAYGVESYTGGSTYCRVVPIGTVTPAHLYGMHDPPAIAPYTGLPAYTLQLWLRLDLDAISTSWGWDVPLVQWMDAAGVNDGLRLDLLGLAGPGAHGWYGYLTHYSGGFDEGIGLLGWTRATTLPWAQLTLVFDLSEAGTQRTLLYLNDVVVSDGAAVAGLTPASPPASGFLQVFHQHAWGGVDYVRLVRRALTSAEVADSYTAAITPGPMLASRWTMQIRVDDVVYAERTIAAAERRRWTDFVAPLRRLTGPHEVAFRLILEAV